MMFGSFEVLYLDVGHN